MYDEVIMDVNSFRKKKNVHAHLLIEAIHMGHVPPPQVDGGWEFSRYSALFIRRMPGVPGPPTNLCGLKKTAS